DEVAGVAQVVGEVPAAEHAHGHARAAGAVDLAATQGVPDGLAAVLLGPHGDEAARAVARAGGDVAGEAGDGVGLAGAEVAGVVALDDGARGAVVGVGAGEDAEAEGVDAEALLGVEAGEEDPAQEVEARDAAAADHALAAGAVA